MPEVVTLEPSGVYDDGSLHLLLGLTQTALAKGRRAGTLKYARKDARVLYLGRSVLDWLEADDEKGGAR